MVIYIRRCYWCSHSVPQRDIIMWFCATWFCWLDISSIIRLIWYIFLYLYDCFVASEVTLNVMDKIGRFKSEPIMTTSNGIIFRVAGPLSGESTCHRWIPLTKGQWHPPWMFLCCWSDKTVEQTFDWQVIRDAMMAIWRHRNAKGNRVHNMSSMFCVYHCIAVTS